MKASVLSSGYTKSVRAFNGRTGPLAWRKTMRGLSGAGTTLSRLSANGLFYGQAGGQLSLLFICHGHLGNAVVLYLVARAAGCSSLCRLRGSCSL